MDASFGIGKKSTSILIKRNLVDVRALLASIEVVDETSALVDRIEARDETRCKEAMSTSLDSKKKEACKTSLRRSTMNASRRH